MTLPPELKARILGAAQNEPVPTRSAVRTRTALLLLSGACALVVVFLLAGGPRFEQRPTSLVVGTVLGAMLAAAVSFGSVFMRGRSMLGRPRTAIAGIAALVPVMLFGWKILWSAQYEGMLAEWPDLVGFRCLGLSLAMAIGPLLALVFIRRRTDPVHPVLTGAAFGVAAGASAWVLTDMWCPVAYPPHLLLGHVLPIVLLAGFGAWLGKRLIALRP